MPWLVTLIYIYIAYYTFKIAITEWKGGKKFASINIIVLAIALLASCIWVEFFKAFAE